MRVIVIGCGRMGSGLAQSLALRGHSVVVLDHDGASFQRLGPTFAGRTIAGHAFDRDALLQADIEHTDALAAVTTSDDMNVIIARAARLIFHVPRVVARLYDPQKAEIYRRLGVQTISTTTWGVHRIAELLSYSDLEAVASLGANVDIVDVHVPQGLAGQPVTALSIPGEVQVVAISRGGTTFLPTSMSLFQAGDLVHIALLASAIDRLRALLGA
ncbi:MAG TPA: TrkA family potassium uptake protein [Roseiflexaceae bacterium]|nr:TrkA family potassium uptake protein [Roseiflexaceae bacterium]